jgi:integrase
MGDTGGLFLLVQPSGGKLWRLKYRVDGKEKKLGIGTYPEISLAAARSARDEARRLLVTGADPSLEKQRAKSLAKSSVSSKFGDVANEFVAKRTREGWSASTIAKANWLLEHFEGNISKFPVSEIRPADVLAILRRVEAKGNLETARRLLQLAGNVFRYAVATARLEADPTRDLRGAITAPRSKHLAAIVDSKGVGALLRAIDGYEGNYLTKYALQLSPHVFLRPGELRMSTWDEIDFAAAVWSVPATRMKMRRPHHVPLSRQAIEILQRLHELRVGPAGLIFPSIRSTARPMSENTLNAALRRLGFGQDEMTAHGFRAMASTLLNEARDPISRKALWKADAIERALAHADSDETRGAYHRGEHWDERVEMAQWWSDHLDQLRKGADIIPLDRAG